MTQEVCYLVQDVEEKEWLVRHYELNRNRVHSEESKLRLAKYLTQSQTFDNFMGKKFGTAKRYGAEGAESMMGFFDEVLMDCVHSGIEEIVVGMAHRGRLNLLIGLMQLPKQTFFHKVRTYVCTYVRK